MIDGEMNLSLGGQKISLDRAQQRVCYVSHAHSDHAAAMKSREKLIIASPETVALARRQVIAPIFDDGLHISLHNSGHILGSTQLRAEHDGRVFVYTGDFKLSDGLTTKGAKILECDSLLIEATYGSPNMIFPDRFSVFEEMAKWVKQSIEGGIVLFGGYSVGKSQELIKFLNEYCGIAPLVDPKVERFSRVYESFGVKLDRVPLESDEAEELLHRDFAAIIPHHKVSRELASCLSVAYSKPVRTALATGWALKGWGDADMLFPISDHADFGDIVRYVEGSNAKNIYCCHGDEQILARELRKAGFNATPLDEVGKIQATL